MLFSCMKLSKRLWEKSSNLVFVPKSLNNCKTIYPHIRRVYVRMYYPELGEPYIGYILRDFEDTYMPERIENAGVARYVERNQEMIDGSDYCIFYYDENYKPPKRKYSKCSVGDYQPKSGTKVAFDYAYQKRGAGKEVFVINLFEREDERKNN